MYGHFSVSEKLLKVAWTSFCIVVTIVTATWQLIHYLHGDDFTTVAYKTFHEDNIDVYPSIGLCFSNSLIDEKLMNYPIWDP